MRIIARKHIDAYARKHPRTAPSLAYWLAIARSAKWRNMNDISMSFRNAKVMNAERVRFEVAGGNFRMIVAFHFPSQACWIKFFGTHEEYDLVNAHTVSMF